MVLKAFLGSFSMLTVAVTEKEGNFSPIANMLFSPKSSVISNFAGFQFCFPRARLADSQHVHGDASHLKPLRQWLPEAQWSQIRCVQVGDRFAAYTNQMMMRMMIWFHPQGTIVQADFPQHAAIQKRPDVLVNRRQGNRWHFLSDARIDVLRAGMPRQRHHGFVNHPALVRSRQMMPVAKRAKISRSEHF